MSSKISRQQTSSLRINIEDLGAIERTRAIN